MYINIIYVNKSFSLYNKWMRDAIKDGNELDGRMLNVEVARSRSRYIVDQAQR